MGKNMQGEPRSRRSNKFFVYLILMIICLLILVVVIGVMIFQQWQHEGAEEDFSDMRSEVITEELVEVVMVTEDETEETTVTKMVSIPQLDLDWDAIMEENEDIYAWIYIPNTNVDYPVLQHPTDDSYYLNYNLDGSKGYPGCIYSELANSKDFTDSVTVLYGHNMKNGTMFRTLHNFEEEDFFNENEYIYVYMPDGKVLVYEIFAAGTYTSTHIINTFGTDTIGLKKYLADYDSNILMSNLSRSGVSVDYRTDRVLVLSTCISGQSSKRYLVQGVVIYDGMPDGSSVEVEVEEAVGTESYDTEEATEPEEAAE
ncbi:MAG: class B sortase [Clostridiales bacterium]|nr:class B sortase [Clostridiales bacterium]